MERSQLLEALLAHNGRNGLSTEIWGEGAAEAARQAVGEAPATAAPGKTVYRLETPLDLRYSIQCDAPERLHFPVEGGQKSWDRSPLTLEVGLLTGAVVRPWYGYHLVLNSDAVVADASSAYWPLSAGALEETGVAASGPTEQRVELPEAFLVCDDLDTTNFCHFICDLLPKIAVAGECGRALPIVIEPPSQRFQQELLELVAHRHGHPVIPLEQGREIHVRRLYYLRRTGHTHPLLRCSGLALNWVRDLVAPRPKQAPTGSILYLGRRDRRRVINEGELIAALQEHTERLTVNYEIERLGVREQAELLLKHETIIGPHGAGFTHLLFTRASPKCAVEIMGPGNGSLSFALISGRLGIQHCVHIAESRTTINGANYPDLEANPSSVIKLLTKTQ